MDEKAHLRHAEEAKSREEQWRLKIEQEQRESTIRLQNLESDILKERDLSDHRIRDFQSKLQTAQQREDERDIDSWLSRIQNEERELSERVNRIQEQIEREKTDSARKIQDYESEQRRAHESMEQHISAAAQAKHDADKKRKQIYAAEVIRQLAQNE